MCVGDLFAGVALHIITAQGCLQPDCSTFTEGNVVSLSENPLDRTAGLSGAVGRRDATNWLLARCESLSRWERRNLTELVRRRGDIGPRELWWLYQLTGELLRLEANQAGHTWVASRTGETLTPSVPPTWRPTSWRWRFTMDHATVRLT
jgi:hypothetical protein